MTRDPIDEFSDMVAVYEPPLVNIGVCSFMSRKIKKASYITREKHRELHTSGVPFTVFLTENSFP